MAYLALAACLLIVGFGALGLAMPGQLVELLRGLRSPGGLAFASGVRLVLGVALFFSAEGSRAPGLLRILGVIAFIAGLALPFVGVERFGRMLDVFIGLGEGFIRVWGALALAAGLALVYAIIPRIAER